MFSTLGRSYISTVTPVKMAFVTYLSASIILKFGEICLYVQITFLSGICLQTSMLLFISYGHFKTILVKEIQIPTTFVSALVLFSL